MYRAILLFLRTNQYSYDRYIIIHVCHLLFYRQLQILKYPENWKLLESFQQFHLVVKHDLTDMKMLSLYAT